MTQIRSVTIEAEDPAAATSFYATAFGSAAPIQVSEASAPSSGFRGFTLSLLVAQPANATALLDSAIAAGASVVKPAAKSLWGFGGVVRAPDGTVWQVATSAKKDTAPASRDFETVTLLLAADDVSASKSFYAERGFTVGKNFGKYVEFRGDGPVSLALYTRKALAKNAGVAPEGSGSHRLIVDADAGAFVDPDGFVWQ
ncbi:glyoxalase [Microbacteriaceae bacterium VKM Ac-2855]|nr:glyoxalase [Microbacteriaceae bacterium VKM Ac-2855]